jgi:hypothetical protein
MSYRSYAYYFASSVETYFAHAKNFVDAADSLSDEQFALTKQVLYAHGVELAMKAFLLDKELLPFEKERGTTAFNQRLATEREKLRTKYSHRIAALWRAVAAELPISKTPPEWCAQLDAGYVANKYPEGAIAHPILGEEEKSELRNALAAIASALKRS